MAQNAEEADMDSIADRQQSVTEILSAHRKFARSTARALEDLVAPVAQRDKPMPDFRYLQQLLADTLDLRWHHLVEAEEARQDAQAQRHALIGERDDEAALLYREVVDLRTILRGRFGAARSKNFIGLRGDTSRDPIVLQRQADRAVARLRDAGRPLPHSRLRPASGPHAARRRWATPVAAAADALRATRARVTAAAKRLDAARLERKRALKGFNNAFVLIAGLFEAIYRAIGRPDLAAGVRPSRRHPGKTYLQVKKAAKPVAKGKPQSRPGVATRWIAPIRRIFDHRRSA